MSDDDWNKSACYRKAEENHNLYMETARGRLLEKEEDATKRQVGGTHYTDMRMDPLDLKFERDGYGCVKHALDVMVDKYLQRDKGDPLENLEKAKHCVELMIAYYKEDPDV